MSDEKRLWPYELTELPVLQAALQAVLDLKTDNLYLWGGQLEVRVDDQRVGYFRVEGDSFVFDLDRKDLSE